MTKKKSHLNHPNGIFVFKKDLDNLTVKDLKAIVKNRKDLFRGYSKHRTKASLLSFMKSRVTTTKFKLKPPKFVDVSIENPINDTIKNLGKSYTEYSIGIDFERPEEPQKVFLMKGERYQTIKLEGFDIFGHTHPTEVYPYPSASDLYTMKLYHPEFIAGKNGNIIIINIEDFDRYVYWKEKNKSKGVNDIPFDLNKLRIRTKKIKDSKGRILKKYRKYLLRDNFGRDVFFRETGVRVYPYRKGMKLSIDKKGLLSTN